MPSSSSLPICVQATGKKTAFLTFLLLPHTSLYQQHPLQSTPRPIRERQGRVSKPADFFVQEEQGRSRRKAAGKDTLSPTRSLPSRAILLLYTLLASVWAVATQRKLLRGI